MTGPPAPHTHQRFAPREAALPPQPGPRLVSANLSNVSSEKLFARWPPELRAPRRCLSHLTLESEALLRTTSLGWG